MFLGNPVFPISFKLEEVTTLIEETLQKKSWQQFEVAALKLILNPFYVFYYDAAFEEQKEGKSIVKKTKRGRLALDAVTGQLDRQMGKEIPAEKELQRELPDEYPVEVKEALFNEQEARDIAVLKTAEEISASKENVILSAFKMVYYPMWIASITAGEKNHNMEISGVTGRIFGEETVPERQKGFVEISRETLGELKKPGAWLAYSKEIAATGIGKLSGKGEKKVKGGIKLQGILRKPSMWLTIGLVIILAIVVLYL
ncbi:MAG: hypothetical protein JW744_02785 [Candidatus Diapherotrites archaeon]|uniref:Uncharacterized protein n=1 Tax=Candidatus Iainarchaeum sp. TaxID=3101447 RepID=A0A939C779_9ARCH|nr:hypothetical protein [Candidatus Diapherotrites archaeon]